MKRLLAFFLAICLCLSGVITAAPQASAEMTLGDPGQENSWRYSDGDLLPADELVSDVMPMAAYPSQKTAYGIDVSEHQGKIDWNSVKSQIAFAIIRCGYGQNDASQDDGYFAYNVAECERLGIPFGLYLYSYANTTDKASSEADHAIRLIKTCESYSMFKLPMYYDLEDAAVLATGKSNILAMSKIFHDKVEKYTDIAVGIYANTSWFNNTLTDSWYQSQPLWCAQYNSSCTYNGNYQIWQYTSSDYINGISGRVDGNYLLVPPSTYGIGSGNTPVSAVLSTNKTSYCSSEAIEITASCAYPGAWVSIYPKGASSSGTSLYWYYLNFDGSDVHNGKPVNILSPYNDTTYWAKNQNDAYMETSGALKPGNYTVYVQKGSNYEVLASKDITVTSSALGSYLATNKDTYAVGERIYVTASYPNSYAWVGFFPANVSTYAETSWFWYYTYNCNNGAVDIFYQYEEWNDPNENWPVPAGTYKVVLFGDGGYNVISTKTITIVDPNNATISTDKSTYCVKNQILVTTNYTSDSAWVGLYKSSDSYGSNGVPATHWYYISEAGMSKVNILDHAGDRAGEFGAGTYQVLLFKDSGYTKIASKTITVKACTDGNKDHKCDYCGATISSHSWSAATCTAPKTCSVCKATEGSALGHNWSAATCTAPKTCSRCKATEGSAKGHSWTAATCTAPKTCSVCKATEGSALGHNWTAATCTAPKTCSRCKVTEGSAKGHSWTAATCTAPKTCSVCKVTEGSAKGHSWTDATCTAPKTCSVCKATEGNPKGHTPGAEATCTTAQTCTVCKAVLVAAKGHTPGAEATCTTAQTCTVCNAELNPAKGHSWTEATCTAPKTCSVCKATEGNPKGHTPGAEATCTTAQTCTVCNAELVAAKGHTPGAAATCTTAQICTVCDAELVAALNHAWKDATCTAPKTCERCQLTEGEALGHADTAPADHECDRCGDTVSSHSDVAEPDHLCDICDFVMTVCMDDDADGNHDCDICGAENVTECVDSNTDTDHNCDDCGKENMNACVDTNPADHKCDVCNKDLGDCNDSAADGDHQCDHCGAENVTDCSDTDGNNKCDECDATMCDHAWSDPVYTWSEDGKTCRATRTCGKNAGHVQNIAATITAEVTTKPTCEAKGKTTYTAIFTQDWAKTQTRVIEDVPAKGHTPGAEATCTTAQTCTVCNAELVAAKGHTPGAEATCTTAQTCTVCNAELVAAKGHTPGAAATCTTAQTCTVCNAELVAAKGHTPGAAATCTTAQTCTVCNAELVAAKGHTPGAEATCTTAQTCTVCNAELVAAKGHTPGAEATCTTAQTCTVCNAELVAAKGHTPGAEATCTTAQTCTVCNAELVAAKGHTPGAEATCTTSQTCTVCNAELVAAKGHTPGAEATCTTAQTCTVCNAELNPAKGHTPGAEATCTTAQTCTVCNAELNPAKGHTAGDKSHKCDICGVDLSECADVIKDHKCDICGEKMSDCVDSDTDHKCDDCSAEMGEHKAAEGKHSCAYCGKTVTECEDANPDHKCDTCGKVLSECADENKDHMCDICGKVLSECADENKDHKCDVCGDVLSECTDAENDGDHTCDFCGENLQEMEDTIRLAGANRWETALKVADEMKANLDIEEFNAIIIASGNDFADALAGSYLSTVKNAPILLAWGKGGKYITLDEANIAYIKANLAEGGTVYILGGVNAVPELYETELKGYNVKRLGGANRFETNLLILAAAGVKNGSEILVCTSTNFADSLSASATGKPILLVFNEYGKLYGKQPDFLTGLKNCTFTVIGGENAVSDKLAAELKTFGKVSRLAGSNRFETSVMVAQKYFKNVDTAVLAYAWNYPDGLCGGSLAFSLKAPLILTMTKYEAKAVEYAKNAGIQVGMVLGGDGLISDDAVRAIFAMDAADGIVKK